jgi:hypothetical protein
MVGIVIAISFSNRDLPVIKELTTDLPGADFHSHLSGRMQVVLYLGFFSQFQCQLNTLTNTIHPSSFASLVGNAILDGRARPKNSEAQPPPLSLFHFLQLRRTCIVRSLGKPRQFRGTLPESGIFLAIFSQSFLIFEPTSANHFFNILAKAFVFLFSERNQTLPSFHSKCLLRTTKR